MNSVSREHHLYLLLTTTFCVVVIVSNLISAKLFPAPFAPELALSAGMITYPLTFLLGDLTTELYGAKKAKTMVYLGFALCTLAYLLICLALWLPSYDNENQETFSSVFSISGVAIFGSMIAYGAAQIIDVQVFDAIKRVTKGKHLWLRNNGSTLISQIIDTVLVNTIVYGLGFKLHASQVLKIIFLAYIYKAIFSLCNTPIFYAMVAVSKKYLSSNKSCLLKSQFIQNLSFKKLI